MALALASEATPAATNDAKRQRMSRGYHRGPRSLLPNSNGIYGRFAQPSVSRSGGRSAAGATRRVVATRVVTGAAIRTPQVTRVSNDEYHDEYWPFILGVVEQIFVDGRRKLTVSHEEVYRAIYNVCCQRHDARLHTDLMAYLQAHVDAHLEALLEAPDDDFLPFFLEAMEHFLFATDALSSLLSYLDRTYVGKRLNSSIRREMEAMFHAVVEEDSIAHRLFADLHALADMPDVFFEPEHMRASILGLYRMDKSYVDLAPYWFHTYVAGLRPTRGLDADRAETDEDLEALLESGMPIGDGNNKRLCPADFEEGP